MKIISLAKFQKEKDRLTMENLRKAREEANISVSQIAKHLGIAPAAYRRYERGEVSPKISVCKKICKMLGKSIGEVFDDDYTPPKEVDLSYRARPGQTLYIKVEVDENGGLVIPEQEVQKIA